MRAPVVLALILSIVAPPMTWAGASEGSSPAGISSLAAPAATICKLGRNTAKADKTFSTDWAAALDRQPQHPAPEDAIVVVARAASLSHLDLDTPPLAPRPPPFL